MNMQHTFVSFALKNLENATGIKARLANSVLPGIDAQITLTLQNTTITLNAEVKKDLRSHQLENILDKAKKHHPFIVLANTIFPKIKEELRANNIAYLEANGNVYMPYNDVFIWVETQKPLAKTEEKINRAFTKTGLKVVMQILLNPDYINASYREMATVAGVSLGNINYVLNGLKEMGFVIKQNKNTYKIINTHTLLNRFVTAYRERLKPSLKIANFSFISENDFINWQKLNLKQGTVWGGEPAGDIITNHLRPGILTVYTTETYTDIIKNYRLVPNDDGNIQVYTKFWSDAGSENYIAPPLLVYSDLMAQEDKRLRETAQIIYEKYIEPNL